MKQLKSGMARLGIGADLRGDSNKKRTRNRLIRAAGLAVATLGSSVGGMFVMTNAFGATISLVTNDGAGTSSFDNTTLGHWSDGLAPAPANDYIVDGGAGGPDQIRTPNTPSSNPLVFQGNSLTLGGGTDATIGIITFKGNDVSGDTITVNNLTLNSGILQSGGTSAGTANTWTLASNNLVIGAGGFAADNGNIAGRGEIIAANITGSGNLQAISNTGAGNPAATVTNSINGGTLTFTGNNSLWSGTELIEGGVLQVGIGGTAGSLGTGNVNVDNTLAFDLTSNSTYTQTFTVDPNLTGTISNISTGTVALSGVTVNGTLNLSNASTGALNFTGPIATGTSTTALGITNSSTGSISIGGAGVTGTASDLNITNGGGIITIGGVATGTEAVTVSGTGTTTIAGTGTYSGNTTVNGGTLASLAARRCRLPLSGRLPPTPFSISVPPQAP